MTEGMPDRWRKGPRPDQEVIELLERLQIAARRGLIRAIVVTTVDPLLKTDSAHAGDLDEVKATLLIGGMTKAAQNLSDLPE